MLSGTETFTCSSGEGAHPNRLLGHYNSCSCFETQNESHGSGQQSPSKAQLRQFTSFQLCVYMINSVGPDTCFLFWHLSAPWPRTRKPSCAKQVYFLPAARIEQSIIQPQAITVSIYHVCSGNSEVFQLNRNPNPKPNQNLNKQKANNQINKISINGMLKENRRRK